MIRANKPNGFTIVELLIVIVVIGILAAIVIVAFNGVQDRAKFSRLQTDIRSTEKIINLYYAENGSYPVSPSNDWSFQSSSNQNTYIPGLVPKYANSLPIVPAGTNGMYVYSSNGTDYKLIRYNGSGLSDSEWNLVPASMKDYLASQKDRWGVWSSGGAGR